MGQPIPQGGLRNGRRSVQVQPDADEGNAVVAFLAEIDMLQYAEPLLANGFDDMETLMEIEDADLADIGMPRGHVIRLRKRLRELGGPAQPQRDLQLPQSGSAVTTQRVMQPTAQMTSSVQGSWEQVKALGTDVVGEALYKELFDQSPEAMELFPQEVRQRHAHWTVDETDCDIHSSPALAALFGKIITALGSSIAGMHETEMMVPRLKQLGMRHATCAKVKEHHFPILQKALMCTLRKCLGESFTPEVEFAWAMVYGFISAIMIQGMQEARQLEKKAQQQAAPAVADLTSSGRDITKGRVISGGLEPYRIDRHLQKAIFGDVYAATGVKSGRKFALKALDMDLVRGFNMLRQQQDHQFCESPLGEVQYREMMRGLDHVVQLQDHFENEHFHFVISELASGGDLLDALRLRPSGFPENQARWLVHGAAKGLASLHHRGLAMQDVSVENMLLYVQEDNTWHVQVCDPGQAAPFVIDPCSGAEGTVPFKGFVGKDFRPPELYGLDRYVATKVDSWCLGWSTFYLLVAQPLFNTVEPSAQDPDWAMFERGEISRLFEEKGWSDALSAEARDFILELMHINPQHRMSIKDALRHPWLSDDNMSSASGPSLQDDQRSVTSHTKSRASTLACEIEEDPVKPAPTLLQGAPMARLIKEKAVPYH